MTANAHHRLLWEIQPPVAIAPSYLLGTMHVKDDLAFRGFDRVVSYLETCTAFAAEFNFEEADPARFTQAAALPLEQQFHRHLSPKVYQKLDRIVQRELGAPLQVSTVCRPCC